MEAKFHIAGLVVGVLPAALATCVARLQTLPGVTVHDATDATRIVVTLETHDLMGQTDGMAAIGALASVTHVALVYHYLDSGNTAAEAP